MCYSYASWCSRCVSILIFYVSIIAIIMPSWKGIKEKRWLGDNPIFIFTVFVCPHDYSTVVIMFYCFCFYKVPSRTFGKTWVKSLWSCCKKTETFALTRLAKTFYWRVLFSWFFLQMITRQIPHVHQFITEFLELQNYTFDTDYYRLFCL